MSAKCLQWRIGFFVRGGATHALELAFDKMDGDPVWSPGYESHDLHDILSAIWYLESGFIGDLTERKLRILDKIKRQAAAELPDFDIYGIDRKGG